MTLLQTPAALSPLAEDRAHRLVAAGIAWNERITADATKAQLTYRATAGRHVFLVNERENLAGNDIAASPVEMALGALPGSRPVREPYSGVRDRRNVVAVSTSLTQAPCSPT